MPCFDPLTFSKCCAQDTRLKCLLLLTHFRELCVCDLAAALGVSQPKLSRHLAELRNAQLLVDERRGKWVYYRLNAELPSWIDSVLDEIANANAAYLDHSLLWLSKISAQGRNCD